MVLNLTDTFKNGENEPWSLADHFIENIHIRLLGCGIEKTAAKKINDFLLPAFMLVYYKKGSAEIRHGNKTIVLKPGSLYIFRPYEIYRGKKAGDAAIAFAYLQFDITPFAERCNFEAISGVFADSVFQNARYRRFGETLEELAEIVPGESGRSAMLRQLTRLLLGQMVIDQSVKDRNFRLMKNERNSEKINHAFQYVAAHLDSPIIIRDILSDGNTSKTSLERAFRATLGTTPQRALMRFKVERSMEMLMQGISLKEIARALGFSSVYHFSNTFKSVTGIRPAAYRDGS